MAKPIDADGLRKIVEKLSSLETPIVSSKTVQAWCDKHDIDWGERQVQNGRRLQAADNEAPAAGELKKWWQTVHPRRVGWSLPDEPSVAAARVWAERNGWSPKRPKRRAQ